MVSRSTKVLQIRCKLGKRRHEDSSSKRELPMSTELQEVIKDKRTELSKPK
jgi:hypothetical protein